MSRTNRTEARANHVACSTVVAIARSIASLEPIYYYNLNERQLQLRATSDSELSLSVRRHALPLGMYGETARYRYQHPLSASQHYCETCGKSYNYSRYTDFHERTCGSSKRSISDLLENTKSFWEAKKRRRLAHPQVPELSAGINLPLAGSETFVSRDITDESTFTADSQDLHEPVATRKGKRKRRLPARFIQDDLPAACPSAQPIGVDSVLIPQRSPDPLSDVPTTPAKQTLVKFTSSRNSFGVTRSYTLPSGHRVTHDPDQALTLKDLSNVSQQTRGTSPSSRGMYGPFKHKSPFLLSEWYWNSSNKSFRDFQALISIFKDPDFSIKETISVNWKSTFNALGANKDDLDAEQGSWIEDDGWDTTPISIEVPFHHRMRSPGLGVFLAGNLRHRNIVSVIKEKILNHEHSQHFHYYPYQASWKRAEDSPDVELYGEMYTSRAFRDAHDELQNQPCTNDEDHSLERVIVALMFWSDATQLTAFGRASLWPCYLFFGNESKYRRCQPNERLCNQIAYFEKLPNTFSEYLKDRNSGKLPTDALIAHCSREIFHKQWSILLNGDLLDAMKDGLRLPCPDGRRRIFYPRIFTYSADYPEKVLVAGIRNNGTRPCHRCLIVKPDLSKLGAPTDLERFDKKRVEDLQITAVAEARNEIMQNHYAIDGSKIEGKLKLQSLVPTENAFTSRLSSLPFNILPTLVVDLMHEFEIGVWKRLYVHLIRLLEAFTMTSGPTLTAELDSRYRATPTFGRDTIRKFNVNASDMKRKAARDFEDLLQCAVPAFDSLLPEPHNTILLELLFICAQWHALAKLRLHNDFTLDLLDYTTIRLGAQMRLFERDTCSKVATKELGKEAEARARREGPASKKGSATRRPASLNVFTIKFHFLGDYVSTIRKFGTCDSYSTEIGELAHRLPKSWYSRTDRKKYQAQMAQIERRQARLARIRSDFQHALLQDGASTTPMPSSSHPQDIDENSPDCRYTIGKGQNEGFDISIAFSNSSVAVHQDSYLTDFIPKLKQHLLGRLLNISLFPQDSGESNLDWTRVILRDNRLYRHKILRLNYTSYDIRRDEDIIHVDTPQSNIMLLNSNYSKSDEVEHPYLYAKVLGIFHVNARYNGAFPDGTRSLSNFHRVDLLWVQWYELIASHPRQEFGLDRVSLCSTSSGDALGFLDPADALRAIHVIPQFTSGRQIVKAPKSRWVSNQDTWGAYYINRFVDRDIFMRYQSGMSVGHTYMQSNHFPAPSIPSLPPGFDYSLPLTGPEAGPSSSNNPSEVQGLSLPDARSGSQSLDPLLASSSANHAHGSEDPDKDVAGDDLDNPDEFVDYLDELDDREVAAFEEMYGPGAI